METVLTIAGFDPSSGAGISADLMVFAAHGLFGTACITALTVQNTTDVFSTHITPVETVSATLNRLLEDLPPAGIKIGMLATAETVSAVAEFVRSLRLKSHIPIVLDPVLQSSSGRALLDETGIARLKHELLPLVDWITPNIRELSILVGKQLKTKTFALFEGARELQEHGRELTVVITAGDQTSPRDLILYPDQSESFLEGERIVSRATHGTGCAFSSSLLCRLVLGDESSAAVRYAKTYVASAIRSAATIGQGFGPINHLWPMREVSTALPRDASEASNV